jgi:hypothetical protein
MNYRRDSLLCLFYFRTPGASHLFIIFIFIELFNKGGCYEKRPFSLRVGAGVAFWDLFASAGSGNDYYDSIG